MTAVPRISFSKSWLSHKGLLIPKYWSNPDALLKGKLDLLDEKVPKCLWSTPLTKTKNKTKTKHVFSIFSSLCIKSESKRHSLFLSKKALCFLLPVTVFAKNAATFECPRLKGVILSTFEYGGINILSVLWQSKCISLSSADYGYRKRSTPQVWNDTRMSMNSKGWRECAGHSWPVLCHPLVHRKGSSIKWIQVQKKKKLIPEPENSEWE